MGHIIQLNGDPHEQVQRLLPWYANGTLDPAERSRVEAHLDQCAECREELALDRTIAAEMASMPADVDRGWAALRSRLDRPRPSRIAFRLPTPSVLRRPIPLGWALSAQAAAIALMVGAARIAAPIPQPVYQALSAPPAVAAGNLIVMFRPDTTEQDLRQVLVRNQARLVDGPTVSDAYILRVAPDRRAAALSSLRADRNVVLAEAIDGDSRP